MQLLFISLFLLGSPLTWTQVKQPTLKSVMDKITVPVRQRRPEFQSFIQDKSAKMSIVVFKKERLIEVWQREPVVKKWALYPMTAFTGTLGPKNRQGDRQIPEGVYKLTALNPASRYYLSLRINYPNLNDLQRAQDNKISDPGGDIYLHGEAETLGCVPMADLAVEEVFYLVHEMGLDKFEVLLLPQMGPTTAWPFPQTTSSPLIYEKYKELKERIKFMNSIAP